MIHYRVDEFQFRRDAGLFQVRGWAFAENGAPVVARVRADGVLLTDLIVQAELRPDVAMAFPKMKLASPVGFRIRGELLNAEELVLELADPAGTDRVAERLASRGAKLYLMMFRRLWDDLRRTDADRLARLVRQTRAEGPRFVFGKIWSRISQPSPAVAQCWYPDPAELARERGRAFGGRAPLISVAVPLYNTPVKYLAEMIESVMAQTYPRWELCLADGSDERHPEVGETVRRFSAGEPRIRYRRLDGNAGIAGNSNAALALCEGEFVALLDHDDLLTPNALYENAVAIERHPEADFCYSDECSFEQSILEPFQFHFKRDFSFENLRSNNFISHLAVFRRARFEEAGGFRAGFDGAQDYDLILRLCEKARDIVHIHKVLYGWRLHPESASRHSERRNRIEAGVRAVQSHLDRVGLAGHAEEIPPHSVYRVRYPIAGTPKISILVADSGSGELLAAALSSIIHLSSWHNREILVAGCRPGLPEAAEKFAGEIRYFTAEPPINRASLYNRMLREAAGDYVVLLDSRAEVRTANWLEELLMFAQRPEVGVVGAKLFFADDTVRCAGIVLGEKKIIGSMHCRTPKSDPGHIGRLLYAQEFQAVSFDCAMMARRFLAEELGGMDTSFAKISDVECCLRAREAGRKVIWTPFAQLKFDGGDPARPEKEVKRLVQLHPAFFAGPDPSYNPNLSQDAADFRPVPLPLEAEER